MKAKHLLLFPIILFFVVYTAKSQSGITDKVNADHDRGQSVAALKRTASEAAAEGDEYKAMAFYGRALEYDSLDQEALNGYGETAMRFGNYEKAEWAYQLLVDHKMTSPDGLQLVKLAEAKVRQAKYAEAKELYRRFLFIETPVGITQDVLDDAKRGLEGCNQALEALADADSHSPLDTLLTINTGDSEFAPYLKGDTLYYSSYHYPFEKDQYYPKRNLIKVLTATLQDETLNKSEFVNFNEENQHTSNVTFNEKGDVMYHTICQFTSAANIRCDIYMRKSTGNNTWGPAVKLPPHINVEGYTNTEPNIGRVPGGDAEALYFVSDRPGGKGKRDIWYSRISQDAFSQPVNLDTLNTKHNDVTPFYHKNGTGALYFSSDGRESFGGYDVYRSRFIGGNWEVPVSLGMPINSAGNDVYLSVAKNGKTSFFASNRNGAQKVDEYEDACCYDIFKADLEKPEMIIVACDELSGDSLYHTEMRLVEITPTGLSEGTTEKVPGAYFGFTLQPRRSYMIIVSKPHYVTDTLKFETPLTIWKDLLVKKLCLTKCEPNLVVTVYDKETLKPLPASTVKFTTIGQVLPSGSLAIDKSGKPLAESLQTRLDTNRYHYAIKFDHRYKVAASKPGYTVDSTGVFSTEGLSQCDTIPKKLYLTRGVTIQAYTISCLRDNYDTILYGVTYRLYDLESGSLKEQFVNPEGTKFFETTLSFDRRYMLTVSKNDYTSDTMVFNTKAMDRVGFQKISHKFDPCPLDIKKYLPIRLYFDNDEPDSNTTRITTKLQYHRTYLDYFKRKDVFIEEYSKGLKSDTERQAARDSIEVLFERDIRGGWERLFKFSEVLHDMMKRGDYIQLTLRGRASPRAPSAYNFNLSKRRVSSVENHFRKFDGSIYEPFVKNGQIVLVFDPKGSKEAPSDIIGDLKDRRNSIYEPRASRERRLEIIGVEVKRGTNGPSIKTTPNLLPESEMNK